jgi:predicted PurR-regulated permease PerM
VRSGVLGMNAGPLPDGDEARLRRSAWWWVRSAAVVVTLLGAYHLLTIVQSWLLSVFSVVLFVVFGGVLALIAWPAVRGLERRGTPRPLAIAVVMVGTALVLAGLGYFIGITLVAELQGLAARVPGWFTQIQGVYAGTVQRVLASRGLNLSPEALGTRAGVSAILARLPELVLAAVGGVVTAVADTVIVLVVCVWLLAGGVQIRDSFLRCLPSRARSAVAFGFDAVNVVFGGYVRAQLLMACLIGVLAGVGCGLLGVPFPVVVGVVAGVFELVPIVGPFAGGAVGLLLALTVSPWLALWTLLLFLGIHVLEGYVLAPRVQARFVRIHPLVAFLALFAGIEVGGFIGALFAVPVASLLSVFLKAALDDWRLHHPELFEERERDPMLERRREELERFSVFGDHEPRPERRAEPRPERRAEPRPERDVEPPRGGARPSEG